MDAKYEVVHSGEVGSCGIWLGDKLVVSAWQLWKRNLTSAQVAGWSQKAIARLVREMAAP